MGCLQVGLPEHETGRTACRKRDEYACALAACNGRGSRDAE